ncbi:bacteriohemerythrin [Pseudodesulfovibrio sp. zrk46]|uniref:bacteriohemerythrin n=1 Tax=Pseudodesulfovibrio sp. zrk46 TaxID=2725288 RepID=UPI0014496790|nr:bacteriohemerythrin [Pseudodesulfovibrio sp. zrk46]QJB57102.1 bacteriohemerythrin [Pseudodesulfovibrio sp. zrk46]
MTKTFRGYLIPRIATFIVILVAGSIAFYFYRASTIEAHLREGRSQILKHQVNQRLEKIMDVGITNAISMASGGNMASLTAEGNRYQAESEIKRIGQIFKAQSNFKDIKIQLFDTDFRTFLRNWMPDTYGDKSEQLVPMLKEVRDSGKALADFVVNQNGFFLRGTATMSQGGHTVGYLQFLQGVGSVSRNFENEGKHYALLIAERAATASKSFGNAPKYGGLPLAQDAWFSSKVKKTLSGLDIAALLKQGSMLTDTQFVIALPLKDIQSKLIGYHILAEPRSILDAEIDHAMSTAMHFIGIMILAFIVLGGLICFLLNRALLTPMSELAEYANDVSKGDTEKEFKGSPRFELDVLAKTIVTMVGNLHERTTQAQMQAKQAAEKGKEAEDAMKLAHEEEAHVSELLKAMQIASSKAERISRDVLDSVNALSVEVDHVAEGVKIQSDRMTETATAMEEMNASVAEVAQNASHAARNAMISKENATTGAQGVRASVESINRIGTRVNALKDTMTQLGQQASSIGQVLNVITDIADQTNLLALNAAIEAARAGEAGRGFAVVADEVRKLAEKTMDATKEVAKAIGSIQEAAEENVQAVIETADDINKSTEAANEAGQFMDEIVSIVDETSGQVELIATASEEQSATAEEINRAVTEVSSIASDTTEGMIRSADNLGSITALISELNQTVQSMASADDVAAVNTSDDLVSWTNKLAMGIDSIDNQHKTLVKLINELNRAMRNKESASVIQRIVAGLKDYVVTHFAYEEKLFALHRYPETEEHKAIHTQFVEKVGDFELALQSGKAVVSIEVMNFLKDWLVEHIMGTDKQYVAFFKKRGVK